MKTNGWQKICLILLFLLASLNFGRAEARASEDHVPDGVTMQEGFKPGFGDTLGIFTKTVGQVLLVHDADTLGYWAEKDLPLYMKDKVVTPEQGLALMQFLDESTISVAEDSELIINRFIFDPDKFDRSTFLSMDSGRARFWVKKLKGYARSEFKVKTKTLIAGVRGSDYVLLAAKDFSETEAIALDDTILEIVSLAAPNKIIILRSLEKVRVAAGQEASPIEKVTPEEAARLKKEFPMPFDQAGVGAAGLLGKDRTIAPDGMDSKLRQPEGGQQVGTSAGDVTVKDETVPTEEEGKKAPILDVGQKTVVLIPENDLVDPNPAAEEKTGGQDDGFADDGFDRIGGDLTTDEGFENIDEQEEEILEDVIVDKNTEGEILVDLPGPPSGP
jgi:hypothetical protein